VEEAAGPIGLAMTAIVVNAMPGPRERAQAIGVWGAVIGISPVASVMNAKCSYVSRSEEPSA